MKKYDCKIILCGPAVGKTYLADHDDRFVDIDGMRAKYKYGIDEQSNEEFERGKGSRRKTINHDSMEYSIKLLEHTIKNNKIALISYQKELLDYVINNNLDFCLVYADINSRDEYIKRMRNRGNNEAFVDTMTSKEVWEDFYNRNENDIRPKYKIKLKSDQYISDFKDCF